MNEDFSPSEISPDASPEQLHWLAENRPDLYPQLLAHPAMYPELAEWIRSQIPAPVLPPPGIPIAPQGIAGIDAPKKKSRKVVYAAVAGGLVLALGVGAAALWFLQDRSEPSAGVLNLVPQKAAVVTVPDTDGSLELLPIGSAGQQYLRSGNLLLTLTASGSAHNVVAVDTAGSQTEPAWVVPLPTAGPCALDEDVLDCGESATFSLAGPTPEPAVESEPKSRPEGDREPGTSALAESLVVNEEDSPQVPYYVADGQLHHKGGEVILEQFSSPAWALPGSDGNLAITNGEWIVGLKDGDVVWTEELLPEDASLNGFHAGQPTWSASGDVLLYATEGGLIARTISTGALRWSLEVPLTSYLVSEDTLLVSTVDSLEVLPLRSEDDPAQSAEPAMSAEPEEPEEEPELLPEPISPDLLLNGTVTVSAACAGKVTGDQVEQTFTFTDGLVTGIPPTGSATITMTDVQPVINEGVPYALVWLVCEPPDRGPTTEIAVYNADLTLVQSLLAAQGVGLAPSHYTEITSLDVGDETLTVTSGLWMGYGDMFCLSCDGQYTAHVSYVWDGAQYQISGKTFDTPSGTVAEPSLEALQNVFDAVASNSEQDVAGFFTGAAQTAVSGLDEPFRSGAPTARELTFALGGSVEQCIPLPSEGTSLGFDSAGEPLGPLYRYIYDPDLRPGDFVCQTHPGPGTPEGGPVTSLWLVRPTSAPDKFQVYDIAQNWG